MTLGAALDEVPAPEARILVAEIQDSRQTRRVRALLSGPLETIAGEEVISRLSLCVPRVFARVLTMRILLAQWLKIYRGVTDT